MELIPKISPSEKDFFISLGQEWQEKKNSIHLSTLEKDDYCCQGCGYRPLDRSSASKILQPHLVSENKDSPLESEFVSLCKACHTTQHIDKAIEGGWVNIVNSSFSQKSLIEICRINSASKYLVDKEIRILKTTPEEYLEQLKTNSLPLHSRIKVIFTSKFEWGDL